MSDGNDRIANEPAQGSIFSRSTPADENPRVNLDRVHRGLASLIRQGVVQPTGGEYAPKECDGGEDLASSESEESQPPDWFLRRQTPPHLRRFPFSPAQAPFAQAPTDSAGLNAHFDDIPPDDEDWDDEEDFSGVPLTDYVPDHSYREPRFEPPSFVAAGTSGYSPRRFMIYLLCLAWWIGPLVLVICGLVRPFARSGTLTAAEIAAGFSLLVGFYIVATLVFAPVVALLWLGEWAFERKNERRVGRN